MSQAILLATLVLNCTRLRYSKEKIVLFCFVCLKAAEARTFFIHADDLCHKLNFETKKKTDIQETLENQGLPGTYRRLLKCQQKVQIIFWT